MLNTFAPLLTNSSPRFNALACFKQQHYRTKATRFMTSPIYSSLHNQMYGKLFMWSFSLLSHAAVVANVWQVHVIVIFINCANFKVNILVVSV